MAQLFAGTSGFAYPSWKPAYYPAKLPPKQFLNFYGSRLNCVEINYTFRTLPSLSTLTNWVAATPENFLFCPKAHMRITHMLKLRNAGEFTSLFLDRIDPLRSARRLGPILFQLPPAMRADLPLLADYLAILPRGLRFSFEFRHASWLAEETYELLKQHNAALCLAESERMEIPPALTADFVYFRLRKEEYAEEDRLRIAAQTRKLLAGERDVFVFFKHEDTPQGAVYAEELLRKSGIA